MIAWFSEHYAVLGDGLMITLTLMFFSLIIGFIIALLFALMTLSQRWYLKLPVDAFVFFVRGTPLLIQFFLFYFGLAQFAWLQNSMVWVLLQEPFVCAVIALSLNTAGYTTVLLVGAIKNIPSGEVEAGYALGMSTSLCLRRIIWPRAWGNVLPAYSNEVVLVLKGTSLASTITLLDLMGVTRQIIAQTYTPIQGLLAAGIIYLLITAIIVAGFKWWEKKYVLRVHTN